MPLLSCHAAGIEEPATQPPQCLRQPLTLTGNDHLNLVMQRGEPVERRLELLHQTVICEIASMDESPGGMLAAVLVGVRYMQCEERKSRRLSGPYSLNGYPADIAVMSCSECMDFPDPARLEGNER